MRVMICLFKSVCLAATSVRMEKTRKASDTESVPSAESFRPVKGKVSGPALALAVDINPTDLVYQRVYQSSDLVRVASENADLLAVARIDHVLDGLIDLVEGQDGNHRPELLFMIYSHFSVDRIQDGRKKEAAANRCPGRIDNPGALRNSVRHQFPQVIRLAFFRDRASGKPLPAMACQRTAR